MKPALLLPSYAPHTKILSNSKGDGGKSTETIAGKIVNLVPWTIESVSSLWNVVTSTASSME
ncbi:hypothetical protein QTG54_017031 [Skeletonema marinoi]|uniref:Uncharacterized protein n=1 Tax=Skeletonema marinoi TaxID=267567 RepID=A0AAD8XRW7_9STRA|nr:hypothetical protein QTG54_017031 [Skeletonema marinoi]